MPPISSALSADHQPQVAATVATGKESGANSDDSGSGKESPHDDDVSGLLGRYV